MVIDRKPPMANPGKKPFNHSV
uniref:Uncharacterized protein n=1 Tax=Anguilla anguilla TaxID=7936 RepID=A0A0E9QLE9_ANGAN